MGHFGVTVLPAVLSLLIPQLFLVLSTRSLALCTWFTAYFFLGRESLTWGGENEPFLSEGI